jgi:hypothetical protein
MEDPPKNGKSHWKIPVFSVNKVWFNTSDPVQVLYIRLKNTQILPSIKF